MLSCSVGVCRSVGLVGLLLVVVCNLPDLTFAILVFTFAFRLAFVVILVPLVPIAVAFARVVVVVRTFGIVTLLIPVTRR